MIYKGILMATSPLSEYNLTHKNECLSSKLIHIDYQDYNYTRVTELNNDLSNL